MKRFPSLHDVYQAAARIRTVSLRTAVIPATELAERGGARSVQL